jgi:hypothetical protein
MRRKQLPGLNVAGSWVLPLRDRITQRELAFILELPEHVLAELLELDQDTDAVQLETARDLLNEMAGCGFTDWREAALFADVISGRRQIDKGGRVWLAAGGEVIGGPIATRTTSPSGAVALDMALWRRRRARAR